MPWIKRKIKVNEDGGDQFHVYDVPILRSLAQTSTRWKIQIKQPDGKYFDPQLMLVTKEEGLVKHDRVQTGGRHIPNLIDVALALYRVTGHGIPRGVDKVYFDVDRHDLSSLTLYITPTRYEIGTQRFPLRRKRKKPAVTRARHKGRLTDISPLDENRKHLQRKRRGYKVLSEKLEDKHTELVDRLRERLTAKGLKAKGNERDIDVHTRYKREDFIFEAKTGGNIEGKARDAIGQLWQYAYLYRDEMKDPHLCIVLDKKPKADLIGFLEYVEVNVCWATDGGFDCPAYCHDLLAFLVE